MQKPSEKKSTLRRILTFALVFIVCLGAGYLIGYLLSMKDYVSSVADDGLSSLVVFLIVMISLIVHLFVHEAGHLVFGLLTGYRFLSFRVGSLMLMKDGDRLRLKLFSIAGTGGQCIMIPPSWREQGFPYALYNLGGALMNVIAGALSLLLWALVPYHSFWSTALLLFAMLGFVNGALNAIPLRFAMVDNDGSNVRMLKKDPKAVYAFYQILNINAKAASGQRLRDLPEEWFAIPASVDRKNPLIMTIEVFAINRLMDQHLLEQAGERISALFGSDASIPGIYNGLLKCDLAYCAMMRDDFMAAQVQLDDQQRKFMRAMRNFPSILRTQYAEALLKNHDEKTANAILAQFERIAKRYPHPSDIESERELLQAAMDKYEDNN